MLGCMVGEGELPGADGINGSLQLWTDANHSSSVTVTCGTAPYVCKHGPGFDNYQGFFRHGSNDSHQYPYGPQSLDNAYANGARPADDGSNSTSINMFSGDQLPVKRAIVRNFGTFNRMFSATPTASTPNHMFTQSGTSCGLDQDFVSYEDCGGIQPLFPQVCVSAFQPDRSTTADQKLVHELWHDAARPCRGPSTIISSSITRRSAFIRTGNHTLLVVRLGSQMRIWMVYFGMSRVYSILVSKRFTVARAHALQYCCHDDAFGLR